MLLRHALEIGSVIERGESVLLAAQGRHAWIALSGAINLLCKLPLAFVLARSFGLNGLVLSTVLMYALSAALLLFFVLRPPRAPRASAA